MKFEEWEKKVLQEVVPVNVAAMYIDWKAEREDREADDEVITERIIKCREELGQQDAKIKKLIGALEWIESRWEECQRIMREHSWRYEDSHNIDQKMAFTMYSEVVECGEKARVALLEVKGEEKELPKFKDIIGLFVDKPEEDKE